MCAAIEYLQTHENPKLMIFEKGAGFGGTWLVSPGFKLY